jgi:hypothetical protein
MDEVSTNGNGKRLGTGKRMGPPLGNMNGFKNGTAWMERGRGRRRSNLDRRIANQWSDAILQDKGGMDAVSAITYSHIVLYGDVASLYARMQRVRDALIRKRPELLQSMSALSKIDSYLAPLRKQMMELGARLGMDKATPAPKSISELLAEKSEPEK